MDIIGKIWSRIEEFGILVFALLRSPSFIFRVKYVVFVHDLAPHGAQMLALALAESLTATFGRERVCLVALDGRGKLRQGFNRFNWFPLLRSKPFAAWLVSRLLPSDCYLIFNSMATQLVSGSFIGRRRKSVSLIHELPTLIAANNLTQFSSRLEKMNAVIFPSPYVRDRFLAEVRSLKRPQLYVQQQGVYASSSANDRSGSVRTELNLPTSSKLVANFAHGDLRKAPDIFVNVARDFFNLTNRRDVFFCWFGSMEEKIQLWLENDLRFYGLNENIRFIPFRTDVVGDLAECDCFVLTSREDPYPSTVLEAKAMKVPSVLFDKGNGFIGTQSSFVSFVPFGDTSAMARKVAELIDLPRSSFQELPSEVEDISILEYTDIIIAILNG